MVKMHNGNNIQEIELPVVGKSPLIITERNSSKQE